MKRAGLAFLVVLALASGLIGAAFAQTTPTAGEKQIGNTGCTNAAASADFDTLAQCTSTGATSGTFQKAPIFAGQVTAPPYTTTSCDSSKAGMIQYTAGGGFQGCDGENWVAISGGSSSPTVICDETGCYLTEEGGFSQIVGGENHTCAVKTSGTVFCWGQNYSGQLGNNSTTTSLTPVQVLGVGGSGYLTGISQIAGGSPHTCAMKPDGSVFCWGGNGYGQLGNNSTTDSSTPVQVLGVGGSGTLTGISQIAGGSLRTCAVKTSGTVFCWGMNPYGELGNNSTTNSSTPVQVLGVGGSGTLTGISQITAGSYHTCAVKTSGTVFCWGRNAYGQLGNNSTTNSSTPVYSAIRPLSYLY